MHAVLVRDIPGLAAHYLGFSLRNPEDYNASPIYDIYDSCDRATVHIEKASDSDRMRLLRCVSSAVRDGLRLTREMYTELLKAVLEKSICAEFATILRVLSYADEYYSCPDERLVIRLLEKLRECGGDALLAIVLYRFGARCSSDGVALMIDELIEKSESATAAAKCSAHAINVIEKASSLDIDGFLSCIGDGGGNNAELLLEMLGRLIGELKVRQKVFRDGPRGLRLVSELVRRIESEYLIRWAKSASVAARRSSAWYLSLPEISKPLRERVFKILFADMDIYVRIRAVHSFLSTLDASSLRRLSPYLSKDDSVSGHVLIYLILNNMVDSGSRRALIRKAIVGSRADVLFALMEAQTNSDERLRLLGSLILMANSRIDLRWFVLWATGRYNVLVDRSHWSLFENWANTTLQTNLMLRMVHVASKQLCEVVGKSIEGMLVEHKGRRVAIGAIWSLFRACGKNSPGMVFRAYAEAEKKYSDDAEVLTTLGHCKKLLLLDSMKK